MARGARGSLAGDSVLIFFSSPPHIAARGSVTGSEASGGGSGRDVRRLRCLTSWVQVRQSSVRGARPPCPVNGNHRVHGHGGYRRNAAAQGRETQWVPRWLCVVCSKTISVLPEATLPYRPVGVELLEGWLDAVHRGRDPPQVTEVERGCLRRACSRFLQRIPSLTTILGQMVEAIRPTAQALWTELRKLGRLGDILRRLAEKFKTSLLGDYRCLKPWSATC